jgi:hypothetical protein
MLQQIRDACEKVCNNARLVRINRGKLATYARSLNLDSTDPPPPDSRDHFAGSPEETVAFILTLDSINFGSGYFPQLRKRENMSGYFTIASALRDRFRERGPFSATELMRITKEDCAAVFNQELRDAAVIELMGLFAQALGDLGSYIQQQFGGRFLSVVETAKQSAEQLVRILSVMPLFQDVARYGKLIVPFYKRAQITAADLAIRFNSQGPGRFNDLDKLTIFADNAVPNVLRVDGILSYEASLAQRIDAGELIQSGSQEEIEIRASALHSAELLVAILKGEGRMVNAMVLDSLLWNRGQGPNYKSSPRHRTRSVFY